MTKGAETEFVRQVPVLVIGGRSMTRLREPANDLEGGHRRKTW